MARYGWQGETGEFEEMFTCAQCGTRWQRPAQGGRAPKYCSDRCKQTAYRDRASSAAGSRASGGASGSRSRSSAGAGGRGSSSGGSAYSSWSTGASGGHSSTSGATGGRSEFHQKHMTTAQARVTIFRIAGLDDDGGRTVKSAYRLASRKLHPDTGSSPEQEELFKLLSLAKSVLDKAGLFV